MSEAKELSICDIQSISEGGSSEQSFAREAANTPCDCATISMTPFGPAGRPVLQDARFPDRSS